MVNSEPWHHVYSLDPRLGTHPNLSDLSKLLPQDIMIVSPPQCSFSRSVGSKVYSSHVVLLQESGIRGVLTWCTPPPGVRDRGCRT